MERTSSSPKRMACVVRGEEDDLVAVGDANTDQFIVFVDADGDDAAAMTLEKS